MCTTFSGLLRCFHFVISLNNAAANTHVQVSESLLSILLCTYEEVELLDHVVIHRVSQVAQW